jgi:hypothetical protein
MFSYILNHFFIKRKKAIKKPLMIINENRKSTDTRRTVLYLCKEEKEKTCLSKYFHNIKGLNTIERNLYSRIV